MNHPFLARIYDTVLAPVERMGLLDRRRHLLSGLEGRVVEVAAGTGPNLPLYPKTVDEVHALEPDQHMLRRLRFKADKAAPRLFVYRGDACRLPFTDGVFDNAIITFALCTIHDPAQALDETHRVVRDGGTLRFLEHVRSPNARMARWQDRFTPLWVRVAGGCRLNRPTVEMLEASRWEIGEVRRFGGGSVVAGQALRV